MDLDFFVNEIIKYLSPKSCDRNIAFSPYGISKALTMILVGSTKETSNQIFKAFGIEADQRMSKLESLLNKIQPPTSRLVEDKTFNGLYPARNDPVVRSEYMEMLETFGCQLKKMSKATKADHEECEKTVSDLTADFTQYEIKKNMTKFITDSSTRIMIVSIVNFKTNWSTNFQTRTDWFVNNDGTRIKVPMMYKVDTSGKLKSFFDENSKTTCLELPFSDNEHSMWFFKREGASLGKDFSVDQMRYLMRRSYDRAEVTILIPIFKLDYEADLKYCLQKYGMTHMFDPAKASLFALTDERGVHVSDIFHKATVELNAEGTEAKLGKLFNFY